MSIRKPALVLATVVVAVLTGGIGSASATTLTTDPGNIPFATGNVTIKNTSSGVWTLTTGAGNITCSTAHIEATINNNHAATLSGVLNQFTLTECSDTIALITVPSCHQHMTTSLAVSTSSISLRDVTIRCGILGVTQACYFTAATAVGTLNNAASTLTYAGVAVSAVNPTGDAFFACPSSGSLSGVLNHIVEVGTNRTVTVV